MLGCAEERAHVVQKAHKRKLVYTNSCTWEGLVFLPMAVDTFSSWYVDALSPRHPPRQGAGVHGGAQGRGAGATLVPEAGHHPGEGQCSYAPGQEADLHGLQGCTKLFSFLELEFFLIIFSANA